MNRKKNVRLKNIVTKFIGQICEVFVGILIFSQWALRHKSAEHKTSLATATILSRLSLF